MAGAEKYGKYGKYGKCGKCGKCGESEDDWLPLTVAAVPPNYLSINPEIHLMAPFHPRAS